MSYGWTKTAGSVLLLSLLCTSGQQAAAITTRHDVDVCEYVVEDADFPAVADLFEPGDCLGTLIDDRHLLTAAHCAVDIWDSDVLTVGGVGHHVDKVFLHPGWGDFMHDEQYDIAIVRLETPVRGVTPHKLYEGRDEEGQELIIVGRGLYGTGLVGEKGAGNDGVLRRATNVVTSATRHWLVVYFDKPGSKNATDLEGVGVDGDSGGPAFIQTEEGLAIAGLNSWGRGGRSSSVGEYGAWDYSARVSTYLDWIDCVQNPEETADTVADELGTSWRRDRTVECPARRCGCSSATSTGGLWTVLPVLLFGLSRRRS